MPRLTLAQAKLRVELLRDTYQTYDTMLLFILRQLGGIEDIESFLNDHEFKPGALSKLYDDMRALRAMYDYIIDQSPPLPNGLGDGL